MATYAMDIININIILGGQLSPCFFFRFNVVDFQKCVISIRDVQIHITGIHVHVTKSKCAYFYHKITPILKGWSSI